MDFLGKLGSKGRDAVNSAKDMAEVASLRGRIRSLEEIIDTQYQEIGKHYYELNGETADPIYQKNCELIDKSRHAIAQIEAQILQVQKH